MSTIDRISVEACLLSLSERCMFTNSVHFLKIMPQGFLGAFLKNCFSSKNDFFQNDGESVACDNSELVLICAGSFRSRQCLLILLCTTSCSWWWKELRSFTENFKNKMKVRFRLSSFTLCQIWQQGFTFRQILNNSFRKPSAFKPRKTLDN